MISNLVVLFFVDVFWIPKMNRILLAFLQGQAEGDILAQVFTVDFLKLE